MKSKKTIVVDGQVLQTSAWSRGMGRYLLSLLGGIEQISSDRQDVIIVFSNNLELSDERAGLVRKIIPSAELVFLDFSKGLSASVEKANTKVLDRFVHDRELKGSVFLLASLFSFDYQPAFPTETINTCIFYDIIPLKRWSTFYQYFPETEYFSRFKLLYTADKIYSISQSVKSDLEKILGFEKDDIVNIDGAEIPNFEEEQDDETFVKPEYRYVLLSGGDSPHKNMLRAIRAFDLFNAEFGDTFKLVTTSYYSEKNIERMTALSSNVVITGEVSDVQLHGLYKHADLVLFPSLDEGLGLPILEAVGYDKKIACSAIPVFREISKEAMFFFDPLDINEMAGSIKAALVSRPEDKRASYAKIKKKFRWSRTAQVFIDDIAKLKPTTTAPSGKKMSIVIEQNGDIQSLHAVAEVVRKYCRTHELQLFIDTRFESGKRAEKIPLAYDTFIKTFDVIDFPRKAGDSDAIVIYTPRSIYSQVLVKNPLTKQYSSPGLEAGIMRVSKKHFLEKARKVNSERTTARE